MDWWIIVLVVVLVVVALKLLKRNNAQQVEYQYRKLEVLFSPAERSFLGVLQQAVGESAQIFGKVRVADVIAPKRGMNRSDWQIAFNKISGKHFDFLLCDKNDISVLCAIELNDSSHNSKKRNERDVFLDGTCQAAKVPLVKITAKATYNINEIRQSIAAYLPSNKSLDSNNKTVEAATEKQSTTDERLCPKCSSKMVKKIAKKGKNVGNEFLACSAFPKCRHIEAINA